MVTIADVARHAGVAPSTVSYVLTGKRSISSQTRSKVRDSIRLLGYHPHAGARALATNRSNVLALVLPLRPGVYLPVLMRFVTAVVTTARWHDMDVLLVTADQGAQGLRRIAGSAQVDGFLVLDVELDDDRVPLLRHLTQPSVLIGRPAAAKGLTCVDLDFEAAGARCVDHLADLGHRYIGFLGAPSVVYQRNTGYAQRAMAGFSSAAMRRGIASTALPAEDDYESVLTSVRGLLRTQPAMTALVVHNEAALGWVAGGLRALGRRVPEDVAVVAICPDELAEQMQLTSVQLPAEQLARQATELLIARLNGLSTAPLTLLPPKLSSRASTSPRPPRG
ncbi:LacI family DNA-binding transcriptional regulator [Lentzea sp. BCCO 10_0798]|uniref:LacI family DNA-binding transcriptional regulator n=1 Tax=Lentzea kristufekii TaxID=3095430 RepID=A0ABU4U620_9PSEU|nr:LacI family DNA-binding transcriptional regulator [Lentzea sp. BCCO 10_0798]MDX8055709.1 LacI family DNA-binding transcriptional regulator [Lentzea sp. BCCO 10_0798]